MNFYDSFHIIVNKIKHFYNMYVIILKSKSIKLHNTYMLHKNYSPIIDKLSLLSDRIFSIVIFLQAICREKLLKLTLSKLIKYLMKDRFFITIIFNLINFLNNNYMSMKS